MANLISKVFKKLTQTEFEVVGLIDADGNLINPAQAGFNLSAYDYVSASYPDGVTEIYTFKVGGSSGATVGIITIVYTDSTKNNISTVTKIPQIP